MLFYTSEDLKWDAFLGVISNCYWSLIRRCYLTPLYSKYLFRTRKNLESGLTLREGGLAQGFKPR
jgi:hypothetical protein